MLDEDPRCAASSPLWATLDQPGIGRYRMPGSPIVFDALTREPPRRAPMLGEHTDEILAGVLGLGDGEIGQLRAAGVIGGPIDLAADVI